MAVLRAIPNRPVDAALSVDASILLNVMAGNVLAASLRIPSGLLIAEGQMQFPRICDHASPYVPWGSRRAAAQIAKSGIRELRIEDRRPRKIQREVRKLRMNRKSSNDVLHQKTVRAIAQRSPKGRCAHLNLSTKAGC